MRNRARPSLLKLAKARKDLDQNWGDKFGRDNIDSLFVYPEILVSEQQKQALLSPELQARTLMFEKSKSKHKTKNMSKLRKFRLSLKKRFRKKLRQFFLNPLVVCIKFLKKFRNRCSWLIAHFLWPK